MIFRQEGWSLLALEDFRFCFSGIRVMPMALRVESIGRKAFD